MDLDGVNVEMDSNFLSFYSVEDDLGLFSGNNEKLNLVFITVRSLRKNWDTLKCYLDKAQGKIKILILVEVNIKAEEISNFSLIDFKSFAKCRPFDRGGV